MYGYFRYKYINIFIAYILLYSKTTQQQRTQSYMCITKYTTVHSIYYTVYSEWLMMMRLEILWKTQ